MEKINQNKGISYSALYYIVTFAFFQQVLVLNFGGSIRISDVIVFLSFLLLGISGRIRFEEPTLKYLFFVFVVSPLIGHFVVINSGLNLFGFYDRFPQARDGLRYEYYLSVIVIYYYHLLVYFYMALVADMDITEDFFAVLCRRYVVIGVFASIYALYGVYFVNALGFPDLIPGFLDSRNNTPLSEVRPSGFSSEAGDFFYTIGVAIIIILFVPGLFSTVHRVLIGILFLWITYLISSPLIVALGVSIFVYNFFLRGRISANLLYVGLAVLIGYEFLENFTDYNIKYVILDKPMAVIGYLFDEKAPIYSTGIRGYHWRLGMRLWQDNPLFGVGGGGSYFNLWKYDIYGLAHLDGSKNANIQLLSELGLFGAILLWLYFLRLIRYAWRYQFLYSDKLSGLLIVLVLFLFLSLNGLSTIYSLWMWIFIPIVFRRMRVKVETEL